MNIDYKAAFIALVKELDAEYTPITEKDVQTEGGLESRQFAGEFELGTRVFFHVHDENLDQALDTFYKSQARGEK